MATIPAEPPSEELARALAAHGQLLMLLSHQAEARARGERRIAVARQVGARAVEAMPSTLGTTLGVLGQMEAAIAHLEQGRRIAGELGDFDHLTRAHANLASVLEVAGRAADAVDVCLAGVDAARQAERLTPRPLAAGRCRQLAAEPRPRRGRAAAGRGVRPGPPVPAALGPPR